MLRILIRTVIAFPPAVAIAGGFFPARADDAAAARNRQVAAAAAMRQAVAACPGCECGEDRCRRARAALAVALAAAGRSADCGCGKTCECETCRCVQPREVAPAPRAAADGGGEPRRPPLSEKPTIAWQADYNRAVRAAQQAGKPLFVLVTMSAGCPACDRLAKGALADAGMVAEAQSWACVRIDAADGELVRALGVATVPTVILADRTLTILDRYAGDGTITAAELVRRMKAARPATK
jgi:hypothetical protein